MRYPLLLLCLTLFIACEKPTVDDPLPTGPRFGKLELIIKPLYNGSPLVFYQDIPTGIQPDEYLYFQKLEFYLAELQVQQTQGLSINLKEVEFVELSNLVTTALSEQGVTLEYDSLPVGTYQQLSFGVGLTDALNAMEPGDFSTLSPLARTGNYWASWNSYILSKTEGTLKQPSGNTNFVYHTGVNGMYQLRNFTTNFTIEADQTTQVILYLRGKDLFFKSGQAISIVDDNFTHSGAPGSREYQLASQVLINIADALYVP